MWHFLHCLNYRIDSLNEEETRVSEMLAAGVEGDAGCRGGGRCWLQGGEEPLSVILPAPVLLFCNA